jgi:hypothetical protein
MRRVLNIYSLPNLNVSPHVQLGQHLVTLVQDEMLQVLQDQLLGLHQRCKYSSQSTEKNGQKPVLWIRIVFNANPEPMRIRILISLCRHQKFNFLA